MSGDTASGVNSGASLERKEEAAENPLDGPIPEAAGGMLELHGEGFGAAARAESALRRPNLADAGIFLLLLLAGFLVTTGAVGLALHFHWFGIRDFAHVQNDTRLALTTQAMLYGVALLAAIPCFRTAWGTGLMSGLHWHGGTALRLRNWLAGTAVVCNAIAMLGNWLLPFPEHAPIDKMFSTTADAWMLMAFGVTVAPFFEEMLFRGFLLPAIATGWDWTAERMTERMGARSTARTVRRLDAEGNPVWSRAAMTFAALAVSAPFALMHGEQVGNAWGPLLLLYCVSLILCAVRLATRSLAASTLVHSMYNFMLFAVMLVETDGFRHMDKM